MRIGDLARLADCSVASVRYYERAGLLSKPRRSESNYRDYGTGHADRLGFILRCRSLDMSLREIRALLFAIGHPRDDCAPVNALLDEHIAHVAERVAVLNGLKKELEAIRAHCAGQQPTMACGILATLARPMRRAARGASHVAGAHIRARAR